MITRTVKRVGQYILDKFLCHPAWTGIGSIAAIVAILVALITLPNQPRKQLDTPPRDNAAIPISIEPSATSARHQSAYWNAESYYSQGLYPQAYRAYRSAIDSIPHAHQINTKESVKKTAERDYTLGNYKLAADQLKELLVPLAEQGVFGQKLVK